MKPRIMLGIMVVVLFSVVALTQGQPSRTRRALPETSVAPSASDVDQKELEALRGDIKRMRVLLSQMQTNLAFVQTSDTPLKHEFDLNNEMWQLVMNDMDRRLQKLDRQKP